MAATVKPQSVTSRWARPAMGADLLSRPPPCPSNTRGARSAPAAEDHSMPGISPTVNSRATTPDADVSPIKRRECITCRLSGNALSWRSRRHLCQSPDRDDEWEHPLRSTVHGSHLLACCHDRPHATKQAALPGNPVSVGRQRIMDAAVRRLIPLLRAGSVWRMSDLVVRFGTLHDRPGAEPRRDGVLVISGERVVGVDVPEPEGAVRLEAACVVPGLVNSHAHLEMEGGANAVAYFAQTTSV